MILLILDNNNNDYHNRIEKYVVQNIWYALYSEYYKHTNQRRSQFFFLNAATLFDDLRTEIPNTPNDPPPNNDLI